MDSQLAWFSGSPDFVAVMFTYNFSSVLKIRVNWQKIHHIKFRKPIILGFLPNRVFSTKHFGEGNIAYCGLNGSILLTRWDEIFDS